MCVCVCVYVCARSDRLRVRARARMLWVAYVNGGFYVCVRVCVQGSL